MSMVQSSDEHSTACLGNKSWRLPVIWKCIRNSLSVWMIPTKRAGLWTHMVYLNYCCNHLWVLRLELNNMYGNEWKDSDLLASNQDSFWCDSIICFDEEIGEDYDEFEGIRTSTCLSFESKLTMIFVFFMISQWGIWVRWFPNVTQWGLGIFYIEWCTMMMIFVRVFSQWGFWVYISVCNPRRYPEHWYPVLAWGECLMVLLMG